MDEDYGNDGRGPPLMTMTIQVMMIRRRWIMKNIAKGTTDPRVEFISQNLD